MVGPLRFRLSRSSNKIVTNRLGGIIKFEHRENCTAATVFFRSCTRSCALALTPLVSVLLSHNTAMNTLLS
eukprot:249782-Amphidinium_carterae.1